MPLTEYRELFEKFVSWDRNPQALRGVPKRRPKWENGASVPVGCLPPRLACPRRFSKWSILPPTFFIPNPIGSESKNLEKCSSQRRRPGEQQPLTSHPIVSRFPPEVRRNSPLCRVLGCRKSWNATGRCQLARRIFGARHEAFGQFPRASGLGDTADFTGNWVLSYPDFTRSRPVSEQSPFSKPVKVKGR